MCKGSDACIFSVDNPDRFDEVKMFQMGRHTSANEAAWRIFGSEIHDHYPAVPDWQFTCQMVSG